MTRDGIRTLLVWASLPVKLV